MTRPDGGADLRVVVAEIEAAAGERRIAVAAAEAVEADLDLAFERVTPPEVGADFEAALFRLQDDACIDLDPPTRSLRKGGMVAKKSLARLMSWYVRYLGDQIAAFAVATVDALHALGERATVLEQRLDAIEAAGSAPAGAGSSLEATWAAALAARFGEADCPVLVIEPAGASMADALRAAGVAVVAPGTGIDDGLQSVQEAIAGSSDGRLGSETLARGAVLVAGQIEPGSVRAMLQLLSSALPPGAPVAAVVPNRLVAHGREAGTGAGVELWQFLMRESGFADVRLIGAPATALIEPLPATDALAEAINDRLQTIGAHVGMSPSACIEGSVAR